MTEKEFKKAGKVIKSHNMDLSQITRYVNLFLEGTHVCEQEMINYLAKSMEMPEEVEEAFLSAFTMSDHVVVNDLHDVYSVLRNTETGDKGVLLYLDTGVVMPADDMIRYLNDAGYEVLVKPRKRKIAVGQQCAKDYGVDL